MSCQIVGSPLIRGSKNAVYETQQTLTQERVEEINARIDQGGWASFFGSLVGNHSRRTSEVTYSAINERYATFQTSLETLAKSISKHEGIRHVENLRENSNPKYCGGISPLLTTREAKVKRVAPPFINTNIVVWGIEFGGWATKKLLFFPDALLIFRSKRYEIASYESLKVSYGTVSSTESSPHSGAKVVGQTWLHTNVEGGPDRRFSENRYLQIVLYGLVLIEAPTLDIRLPLLTQDEALASDFAAAICQISGAAHTRGRASGSNKESAGSGRHKRGHKKRGKQSRQGGEEWRQPEDHGRLMNGSACEVLGVSPDAARSEIVAAYRKMVTMYHPDKVSGLGPEFNELAERRIKEINAAYEELSKAVDQ